jgi:hypothetical protein
MEQASEWARVRGSSRWGGGGGGEGIACAHVLNLSAHGDKKEDDEVAGEEVRR